ncbi:hypothetical protein F4777DRAFT_157376 [Nemania sp. FL0916]|nr:hypothetical protein F4777DRAFT_157376 [Nemania sp. FL0916]
MAVFQSAYDDFYTQGLKYEFITEMSPGIWKISRKSDRMEFLAENVTNRLFSNVASNPKTLTDFGRLLSPLDGGHDLLPKVAAILNHPNLVCLVDCFCISSSASGDSGRERWYAIWDYCDAGNLANLFAEPQPRPQDPVKDDSGDTKMIDAGSDAQDAQHQTRSRFMPESFCWHVLTSLLRALSWLHDGVRDVAQQGPNSMWMRMDENTNWSPMLHRNIHPENIFIGYPRRKEWYGPVKLGNYRRLHISGHCPTVGSNVEPTSSKAMAPPPGQDHALLDDLITFDTVNGSVYPLQPGQPYTMVSEYRALGEIIQCMMVKPTDHRHKGQIQLQSARVNLQNLDYTARLRNFVVKLMEYDPWQSTARGAQKNPIYVTSQLYREAQEGVQFFMNRGSDEAKAYMPVTARTAEAEDNAEREAREQQETDSLQQVHDILEYFDRVTNGPPPPDPLAGVYREQ